MLQQKEETLAEKCSDLLEPLGRDCPAKGFCTELKRVQVKRSHVSEKMQDSAGVLVYYEAEKLTLSLWWRIRFLAKW